MVCLGTFGAVVSLIISSLHLPARLPRYRITGRYVDIQHPIRGVGTGGDSGVNIRTRISGLSMGNKSLRSLRNQHTRSAACFDLSICSWNATQTADGGLSEKNSSTFYGTVGIFRVPRSSSQFLAIIKDAVPAEHIGEGVFKVKEIGLIRIPRASVHTTEPRTGPESENASDVKLSDEERDAFEMLRRTFARHSFYFSSGAYDVSRTLQSNVLRARVRAVNASAAARSLDCDPRFFWNHDVARPLIDAGCKDLVTPIINMWTQSFVVGGHRDRTKMASLRKQCILTLIARRSRFRQGPRYSKRGIDKLGHVANFVESEQILRWPGSNATSSFVQIRGSIPLFWRQDRLWKLKPRLLLESLDVGVHARALKAHLKEIYKAYIKPVLDTTSRRQRGDVSMALVNLIDKTGPTKSLGIMMSSALLSLSERIPIGLQADVEEDRSRCSEVLYQLPLGRREGNRPPDKLGLNYLWFDQHYAIARSGGVDAMKELYQKIRPFILESKSTSNSGPSCLGNYFQIDHAGNVVRFQRRLIRTNCIDCLDRTNFAQSQFAKWSLESQLAGGIADNGSDSSPDIDTLTEADLSAFRQLWANHGDAMSLLYSGTRAMKRDLTRHGRRTLSGVLQDGVSFAWRYFLGNFRDSERQRGIDMVLGAHNQTALPEK